MKDLIISDIHVPKGIALVSATAVGKGILVDKKPAFNGGLFKYTVKRKGVFTDRDISALVSVDGVIVRELWQNITKEFGDYYARWDFLDNEGNLVLLTATSVVKILISYSRIRPTCGHKNNNSADEYGPNIHRGGDPTVGLENVGTDRITYITGYEEIPQTMPGWKESAFHTRIDIDNIATGGYGLNRDFIRRSGNKQWLYIYGQDSSVKQRFFCYRINVATGLKVPFTAGVEGKIYRGKYYDGVIAFSEDSENPGQGIIAGGGAILLSQKKGVEICRDDDSGQHVRFVSIPNAKAACVDSSNKYWLAHGDYAVSRYTITGELDLSAAELTLADELVVISMRYSRGEIWIYCGGETAPHICQNVRIYDATTGAFIREQQQRGGNVVTADVNNQTLLARSGYDTDTGRACGDFVFSANENEYYITSSSDDTIRHYTRTGEFIDSLVLTPRAYPTWHIHNSLVGNISRFIVGHREYLWDHAENDHRLGFTLAKNREFFQQTPGYENRNFEYPVKYPSGRVFGLMESNVNGDIRGLFELTTNSYRFIRTVPRYVELGADYNLYYIDVNGKRITWKHRACLDVMAADIDFGPEIIDEDVTVTDRDNPFSNECNVKGEVTKSGVRPSWNPQLYPGPVTEQDDRNHLLFVKKGKVLFRGKRALPRFPPCPFQRHGRFRTDWRYTEDVRPDGSIQYGVTSGGSSTILQVVADYFFRAHYNDEFHPSDSQSNVDEWWHELGFLLTCYGQTSREREGITTVPNAVGNGIHSYTIWLPLLGIWRTFVAGESDLGITYNDVPQSQFDDVEIEEILL